MRPKEGEAFWASLESSPASEDFPEGTLYLVITDVSERHRAQEETAAAAREWQTTFNAVSDSVAIVERGGRIVRCNEATARLIGKPVEEIVGQCCWELVHGADEPIENCPYTRMKASHHTETEEMQHRNRWLSVTVDPILDEHGEIASAVHTMADITERKQAEEERIRLERQVQHAQKLESLGVLAGGVAHDFNNILMTILGNVDLALNDLPPASPARESIVAIERAGTRAAELARKMLDYSGRGAFTMAPVDLRELLNDCDEFLKSLVSKKVEFRYDLAPNLPHVKGDHEQLTQVVLNIVLNAAESIGGGVGAVSVTGDVVERSDLNLAELTAMPGMELGEGQYVRLQVEDTGCGMDEDALAQLFDPFFTTKLTGRGLGLASVLGIMKGHRGGVAVSSTKGKGSTFTVLIPATEDEAVREPDEAAAEPWTLDRAPAVLVVDDEEGVLRVTARMLDHAGFAVLTAKDGEEAVAVFRENRDKVDAVLLDLTMPHMDGAEALRELLAVQPDVPVLIASGYSSDQARERLQGAGKPAGFIHKPFKPEELLRELGTILTRGRTALGGPPS